MAFFNRKKKQDITFDPFGDVNARWYNLKDNEDYAKAFQEVPELYSIISYIASQFSKGIWRCKNLKDGELIPDDKFLKILNKPNPLQSKKEHLESIYIDYAVFGNAYEFLLNPFNIPTIDNVAAIYNLDARYTYPEVTGKLFKQTNIKDIISNYKFEVRGQYHTFETDSICQISNNNIDFLNGAYATGKSPLKSLDWALSNIKAAYEARNVYITRRGAFGVLTNNSQGEMGIQPIPDKEKLQESLNKYGLTKNQWQIILTNASLKWEPMSIPTKDLELYKETRESSIAIASAYKLPILILNYLEGSTYSNLEMAHRQLYSDAIIPFAEHYAGEINRTIDSYSYGKEYFLDYSHIEALQKDKKIEAEKNKTNTLSILAIQKSIKEGNTSPESAIQILIKIYGYKENEAKQILGKIKDVKNEN